MSQAILESQPKKDTKSATTEQARNIAQVSNASVPDFSKLVSDHRPYFLTGATRSTEWRERQLIALRSMMKDHAEDFYAALWSDLRRNRIEADLIDVKYMTRDRSCPCAFTALDEAGSGKYPLSVGAITCRSAIRSSRSRVDHRDMELSSNADIVAVSRSDFRG